MTSDLFKTLEAMEGESPNSYQAFCDYVAMGYTRSLPKLIERYRNETEASPTVRLATLKAWSKKYEWQRRINDYQQELALSSQMNRVEAFTSHMDKAIPMADALVGKLQQMLEDFQRLRTTRRQLIDDPRDAHLPVDQRRQIESIQTKVNVNDLQKLVATFGTLNKDLRTAMGLPNVTEIKGIEPAVLKTYISVSPDDWDAQQTPALPEHTGDIEDADPLEDFE